MSNSFYCFYPLTYIILGFIDMLIGIFYYFFYVLALFIQISDSTWSINLHLLLVSNNLTIFLLRNQLFLHSNYLNNVKVKTIIQLKLFSMFHHNQSYTIQIIIWISITIVALKIKTIHQKSYLMMGKMNFLTFQMDRSFDEIAFFF